MTDQEVIDLINRSLAEEFELDLEKMVPEANLYEDLGLDSLDAVDMVIVLETAFNFKIRDNDAIKSIRTLGDLYNFVFEKKKKLEAAE